LREDNNFGAAKTAKNDDFYTSHVTAWSNGGATDISNRLSNSSLLELLENKALLEKRINIRASDYRFEDKKKFYVGFSTSQGKDKKGTDIFELKELAKNDDFVEKDLTKRNEDILNAFADFLEANGLVQ